MIECADCEEYLKAIDKLEAERDMAKAEVKRLMSLVKEWLDGNARLGRPMSIADQRFLNGLNAAVRLAAPPEEKEESRG